MSRPDRREQNLIEAHIGAVADYQLLSIRFFRMSATVWIVLKNSLDFRFDIASGCEPNAVNRLSSPLEISSRSARLRANLDLLRCGARIPPVRDNNG
jgi:hypothetical protein